LELEQLPLLAWMSYYPTTQVLTTSIYTYIGPEERMQKLRKDYISSPAVRDNNQ